jgi:nucleoside-diphosphate-sugar epimerase
LDFQTLRICGGKNSLKVAITGANGYIGERLIRAFKEVEWEVVALTRRPLATGIAWAQFDLDSAQTTRIPTGVNVIIHAAAYTRSYPHDELLEVRAAQALLAIAAEQQIRFVFVSSQAASPLAQGYYGLSKHRIEELVLGAGGSVIRPGQVFGGPEKGLFGDLIRFLRSSWVVPRFLPAPMIHPVHVDDLARIIVALATKHDTVGQALCVGAPVPIEFDRFLLMIAKARGLGLKIAIPIPGIAVIWASRILPKKLAKLFGLDRLSSLLTLPAMDMRLTPKEVSQGLRSVLIGAHRSGDGQRRHLLIEGKRLLTQVLRAPPEMNVLIRHVRCVEALHESGSARGTGGQKLDDQVVGTRMNVATLVAEASTQGARRFLGPLHKRHWLSTFSNLTLAVTSGLISRLISRFTGRWRRADVDVDLEARLHKRMTP